MIRPVLMLTVCLFVGAGSLQAGESFHPAGFKFFKEIQIPAGTRAAYGRVQLDEEVVRHAGDYDRIFAHNGRALPSFARRVPSPRGTTGRKTPRVIFRGQLRGGRSVYNLELPTPPKGAEYHALGVRRSGVFETSVLISSAAKPGKWERIGRRSLFRYRGSRASVLHFRAGAHRFLRLEFDDRARYSFTYAKFRLQRQQAEFKADVSIKNLQRSEDTDARSTVLVFKNERRLKVHRLVLRFSDQRFARPLRVDLMAQGSRKFTRMFSSRIARRRGETGQDQVIDLPRAVAAPLKIIIENGDDQPLKLEAFEAYSPKEELLVQLPDKSGVQKIRLYYGNAYLRPPNYDIRRTYDAKRGVAVLTAGKHAKNPEFASSIMEPPLSVWIIRILFYLGLLGLAYPAYRVFTNFASTAAQDEDAGASPAS